MEWPRLALRAGCMGSSFDSGRSPDAHGLHGHFASCFGGMSGSMVADMHWATPEERRNLGQARRKQVGRQQHDAAQHQSADSRRHWTLLERAERGRVAGAAEAETPTDGAVAVCVFSRRGAGDGGGSGGAAQYRHRDRSFAAMRMCATWARLPRRTGGWSSTSTISTRRFAGRLSGI